MAALAAPPSPAPPAVTSGGSGRGRPSHGNCATVGTPRPPFASCRRPARHDGQPPPPGPRRRQPPGREVRGARRGGRAPRGGLSAPPRFQVGPAAPGRRRRRPPRARVAGEEPPVRGQRPRGTAAPGQRRPLRGESPAGGGGALVSAEPYLNVSCENELILHLHFWIFCVYFTGTWGLFLFFPLFI